MKKMDTVPYKGYSINVYADTSCQSPDEWEDESVFLVAFHRDFFVKRDGFSQGVCQSIMRGGKYEDDSICYEAKDIMKKYHIFGLEAYIHSGVSLSLSYEGNYPDRRWDVSQLGLVFVAKTDARTKVKAKKLALGLIEDWNNSLSGNVYGFMIEKDGEESGGCWGFSGDYAKSGLIDHAKDEIDGEIKSRVAKHTRKLKAFISQNVPLEKRVACTA